MEGYGNDEYIARIRTKRKNHTNFAYAINTYSSDGPLYKYADRYWDGKINAKSCSIAIRLAMNDDECPISIDPFESLVYSKPTLYKKVDKCGQVYNQELKIVEFIN